MATKPHRVRLFGHPADSIPSAVVEGASLVLTVLFHSDFPACQSDQLFPLSFDRTLNNLHNWGLCCFCLTQDNIPFHVIYETSTRHAPAFVDMVQPLASKRAWSWVYTSTVFTGPRAWPNAAACPPLNRITDVGVRALRHYAVGGSAEETQPLRTGLCHSVQPFILQKAQSVMNRNSIFQTSCWVKLRLLMRSKRVQYPWPRVKT